MKNTLLTITLMALAATCAVAQQPASLTTKSMSSDLSTDYTGKLGIGVIAGEPTGASVKYWFNDTLAIDGAAGWSLRNDTDLYLHSDVLWHNFNLIQVSRGRLPLYFGVGGLARLRRSNHPNEVGIRVPVGLSYMFDNAPVDVFAEVAPAIDVAPAVRGGITGGVGIRFWF